MTRPEKADNTFRTPAGKGKPLSREETLERQIAHLQHECNANIEVIAKEAEAKIYKALTAATIECGKACKACKAEVDKIRLARDARTRAAAEAHELALRAAKSVFDKSVKSAIETFDIAREAFNVALTAQNNVIEAGYNTTALLLSKEAKDKAELLVTALNETLKPLAEELKGLRKAAQATEKRAITR